MKDQNLYLINIIECIERIESYTKDGRKAFMQNTMAQDKLQAQHDIFCHLEPACPERNRRVERRQKPNATLLPPLPFLAI